MKKVKMSLQNIEGALSRAEMKKIMAGSDSTGGPCLTCYTDQDCKRVNKGTCSVTCPDGQSKGCSGWSA